MFHCAGALPQQKISFLSAKKRSLYRNSIPFLIGVNSAFSDLNSYLNYSNVTFSVTSGTSKGGARDARPLEVRILSISCSFWENLAKLYVGASRRVGAPTSGKSGYDN